MQLQFLIKFSFEVAYSFVTCAGFFPSFFAHHKDLRMLPVQCLANTVQKLLVVRLNHHRIKRRQFFERSNAFVPADNFSKTGPLRAIQDFQGFDRFVQVTLVSRLRQRADELHAAVHVP